MMKRFFLFTLVATMLCFGMALAQPNPPADEDFDDFDNPNLHQMLGEKLGLTAEQKEQIHKIKLDTHKKSIDVGAKSRIARIELHELLGADTPDQKKIDAKIEELSQFHETMLRNHVETALAMNKVLTAEQRAKLKELRPMMGFGRHDRMGGFGHGPGAMGPRHMGPRPGAAPREQQQKM